MKTYEKPSTEVITVEGLDQLLQGSYIEIYDEPGSGGQLSKRRIHIDEDEEGDDDVKFDW